MFILMKQVFIAVFSFSGSLATKCVCLSNETCMARPTLIDLNPSELNYYPFTISLDTCNGSCNVFDNVSTKICVPSKTKDVTVKGAKATCVEIASEMKKCSRLKDMLNFNIL